MPRLIPWTLALVGATVVLPPISTFALDRDPGSSDGGGAYNLTQGESVKIPARHAKLPLLVYGESPGQAGTFVASGYMGDTSSLRIKTVSGSAPAESGVAGRQMLRIQYLGRAGDKNLPFGREGWAGIYWQTPANNWAKVKGAGYNLSEAKRLTFWARGEKGGETIAEIKVGGLMGPYPDTDSASLTSLRLSSDWKKYTVDLTGKDLHFIIGAFAFILRREDNPRGATFYLDEIKFETDGASPSRGTVSLSSSTDAVPENVAASSMPATSSVTISKSTPTALSTPTLDHDIVLIVPFPSAKVAFMAPGRETMAKAVALALKYPSSLISIEGHTDSTGPADVNQRLSYQRAQAVSDYLEQQGVVRSRLTVSGFGATHPVTSNKTPEGRLKNRRVEVRIRAKDGLK